MRDLHPNGLMLIYAHPDLAKEKINRLLAKLLSDEDRSINDWVVGDVDFEELISTLLSSKKAIDRYEELCEAVGGKGEV